MDRQQEIAATAAAVRDLDPLTLLSLRALCKTYPPLPEAAEQPRLRGFKITYQPDLKRWLAASH